MRRAHLPTRNQEADRGTHGSLNGVDGLTVLIRCHIVVLQGQVEVALKVCLDLQKRGLGSRRRNTVLRCCPPPARSRALGTNCSSQSHGPTTPQPHVSHLSATAGMTPATACGHSPGTQAIKRSNKRQACIPAVAGMPRVMTRTYTVPTPPTRRLLHSMKTLGGALLTESKPNDACSCTSEGRPKAEVKVQGHAAHAVRGRGRKAASSRCSPCPRRARCSAWTLWGPAGGQAVHPATPTPSVPRQCLYPCRQCVAVPHGVSPARGTPGT